ncbi:MAG: IMP dehydrogenase [Acidimicrobiia bacterium]|nr:IMP dehydrogenase [Acidimicrobiia bacterium]
MTEQPVGRNHELLAGFESLTFDDVLVVPGWSEVLPTEVSTRADLAGMTLEVPLLSAAMDTVTEAPLAIAMAREGGIGILHRNLSIADQAAHVERVKRAQAGMITSPLSLGPTATLGEAEQLMALHKISGVPIVDGDDHLVGILTNRDVRFCTEADYGRSVTEFMTPAPLVTAPTGTSLEEAVDILHEHRIEKLPLVDGYGRLTGLITVKDISKRIEKPNASLDANGRLRVGAAIGVVDAIDRSAALVDAGVDVLVIDTAHGHTRGVVDTVSSIKQKWPEVLVIGGNVVTAEGAEALIDAGADVIKVGVGAGSICTTRVVAGAGMPQLSAVYECAMVARPKGVPIIADGGIVTSGDIVKAFVAGADAVMLGNALAGVDEAPGELELVDGAMWKTYRGMGSAGAMRGRAADRYGSGQAPGKHVAEGIEARVRYAGSLSELIGQLIGGLRSGMGYAGAADLEDLRTKTRLTKITGAGLRESHPHDVQVIREEQRPGYA